MMDEFELDEGALYGAEEGELRSSELTARKSDDGGGAGSAGYQDGRGDLNDSDDESSTTVDVGENLRDGLSSLQSFSAIAPIPGLFTRLFVRPSPPLVPTCAWGMTPLILSRMSDLKQPPFVFLCRESGALQLQHWRG